MLFARNLDTGGICYLEEFEVAYKIEQTPLFKVLYELDDK